MAESIIMPRQGQSVESCIFSEWFVKEGEVVKKGDALFAYETDKASFEQEALADGVLLAVLVQEGDEVPVLETIGYIGSPGESVSDFTKDGGDEGAAIAEQQAGNTENEIDQMPHERSEPKDEAESKPTGEMAISPRARALADKEKFDFAAVQGSGPYGRIIEQDIRQALKNKPKSTPLARAIASTDKVSLPEKGSGAGGKVLAADVKQMPSITLADDFEDKKISNIRKLIAQNMYESLANTAQLTLHTSADARAMLAHRKQLKAKQKEGYGYNITINDMVSYAAVRALLQHPDLNAHFMGDSMRRFSNVHLGFAVDTPRGLMVPTVKNANRLTIEGLSATVKELATACQSGSIDPELMKGATFTLTNLGAYGIEMFTPVLNPPQTGILGINTIAPQPADLGDGVFGFVPRIGLSLTFDHRAVDGAPAAAFLQTLTKEIEELSLSI